MSVFHSFIEAKEAHVVEESVQACVGLATLSHESGESNRVLSARHLTRFINLQEPLETRRNRKDGGESILAKKP